MTFNIRFGTAQDGDNAWPLRREFVFRVIRDDSPDILGVQEALQFQLDELLAEFPHFGLLGIGRDANGGGEYSAILYRRSRFDIWKTDVFWLSDTPDKPGSVSWGNQLPRICTSVRIFDRQNACSFYVFNTHWDHQSQPARVRGGQLIAKRLQARAGKLEPVIVMGDFNVGEHDSARAPLKEAGLRDSYRDNQSNISDSGTFHGFRGSTEGEKIDAILVSNHWVVSAADINRRKFANRYPSDHFPVTATASLKEP